MSDGLRIAENLTLPLDVVVEATAVVGKRGRGKTFTAKRIVEEARRAGVTVLVIDPTDVWYGLRSGADGSDADGLDVIIVGGRSGDLPLHEGAGKMLARLVLDGTSIVVVPKGLPKSARRRLVGELLAELYDRADGTPILVVIDEADEYAPQGGASYGGNRRDDPLVLSLGAVEDIVRRGRAGGLGSLLITQRVAVLSKNVLEQSDTLIALGVTGKNDIDAVAGWIAKHAPDVETGKQIVASLPALPKGTAWVWSPEYGVLECVEILPITTYDSSRSPRVGEVVAAPKSRKAIDLDALGAEMARFAEEMKADDPRELRRQLKNATDRLRLAHDALVDTGYFTDDEVGPDLGPRIVELWSALNDREVEPPPEPERIEIPVLSEELLIRLEGALSPVAAVLGEIQERLTWETEQRGDAVNFTRVIRPDLSGTGPAGDGARPVANRKPPRRPEERPDPPSRREPDRPTVPRAAKADPLPGVDVTRSQQQILDALAWWEAVGVREPSKMQVAMVVGVHVRTKTYLNNLGAMRTAGIIDYPTSGTLALTDAGQELAIPPAYAPTDERLQAMVYEQVGPAREQILRRLVEIFPAATTKADLAAEVGVHERTKTYLNNLGSLRTLGFVCYPRSGQVAATTLMFVNQGGDR